MKPTICAKCVHKWEHLCEKFKGKSELDFVSGEMEEVFTLCKDINHGNCEYYKPTDLKERLDILFEQGLRTLEFELMVLNSDYTVMTELRGFNEGIKWCSILDGVISANLASACSTNGYAAAAARCCCPTP